MNRVAAGSRIVFKNILFATDLSECTGKALPHALWVRDAIWGHDTCCFSLISRLRRFTAIFQYISRLSFQ